MSYDIWLVLSTQCFIKFALKIENHYDMNKNVMCMCLK